MFVFVLFCRNFHTSLSFKFTYHRSNPIFTNLITLKMTHIMKSQIIFPYVLTNMISLYVIHLAAKPLHVFLFCLSFILGLGCFIKALLGCHICNYNRKWDVGWHSNSYLPLQKYAPESNLGITSVFAILNGSYIF